MDRTVHSIITVLNTEKAKLLESLGDLPKSTPFEHGLQVGQYQGIRGALEIIEAVLDDQLAQDANL